MKIKTFNLSIGIPVFCLFIAIMLISAPCHSQGVSINETNTPPDPSAMLEVQSNEKGVLVPRMTQVQRNAIPAPATGLLIYQTDNTPGFYYNAGTLESPDWKIVGSNAGVFSQWSRNGQHIFYPSGRVGVGTSAPAAELHVRGEGTGRGNVLFTGAFKNQDPGDPPASGAGTRMMWYADKAAFRAGMVLGDGWNKNNIGAYSVAMGYDVKATDLLTFAFGESTTASNWGATAMGYNTHASGLDATALGHSTAASELASTSMGFHTKAMGAYSTATGLFTEASGLGSFAAGSWTVAPSAYEMVIGYFNTLYTPADTANWNNSDRLFVIGNGTGHDSRSNALVVMKNGNVGLGGRNNPQAPLDVLVTETRSVEFTRQSQEPVVRTSEQNWGYLGQEDRRWWRAYVATYYGVNTSIQSLSDERYKSDIKPLEAGLAQLMKLNPVRYNLIEDKVFPGVDAKDKISASDIEDQMGFIAQEVQQLFPQLVKPAGDNSDVLTLGYSGLIPVLVRAIQEQQEIIEKLKTDTANGFEVLLDRIQALEAKFN